jgi:hypothetical protein
MARACAILGEVDDALAWLDKAISEKSTYIVSIGVDFSYANIRSNPRFQDILDKIDLAHGEIPSKIAT